jgi:nitrate reductase NapE component
MHLHVYRDESRSAHIDVEGEGDHPWTFDIVTVMAVAILVVGFVGAFAAHLIR